MYAENTVRLKEDAPMTQGAYKETRPDAVRQGRRKPENETA